MSSAALYSAAFSTIFLTLLTLTSAQCSTDLIISDPTTLNDYSTCTKFIGDITIQSVQLPLTTAPPDVRDRPGTGESSGDQQPASGLISIPFQAIEGSLVFSDIGLESDDVTFAIEAPNLVSVDVLTFSNLNNLFMPKFSALTHTTNMTFENVRFHKPTPFSRIENWQELISVEHLDLTNTSVTQIGPFSGDSDLNFAYVDGPVSNASIVAINNPYLVGINITGYVNFTTNVNIRDNARLQNVNLMDVRIGNTVVVSGNDHARSLDFPELYNVSILSITNNTDLKNISLPLLSDVGVSFAITGPVNDLSVPELHSVDGDIDVSSSGTLNCSQIEGILHPSGTVHCTSNAEGSSVSTSGSSGSTSATNDAKNSRSSGGLSRAAEIGIGVGAGVGGAIILVAIAFLCIGRRRRRPHSSPRSAATNDYTKSELNSPESSAISYNKIPFEPMYTGERRYEPEQRHQSPTSPPDNKWIFPEQAVPSTEGRAEMEEQQRPRHEMDARSLPDMELSDSDEEDRRSLEDIERVHNQR